MGIEKVIAEDIATNLGKVTGTYVFAFELPKETRIGMTVRTFDEERAHNALKKKNLTILTFEEDYPTSRDMAGSALVFLNSHRGILDSNGSNWSTVGLVQARDIGPNAFDKYVFAVETTIAY